MSLAFLSNAYDLGSDPESAEDEDGDEGKEKASGVELPGMEIDGVEQVLNYLLDEVVAQNGKEKLVAVVKGYPVGEDKDTGGGELEASPEQNDEGGGENEVIPVFGAQIEDRRHSSSSPGPSIDNVMMRNRRRRKRVGNWMWGFKKRQLGGLGHRRKLGVKWRRATNKRSSQMGSVKQAKAISAKTNDAPPETDKLRDKNVPPLVRKVEPFKCPFCLEAFPGRDGLIKHLETHTGDEEAPESMSSTADVKASENGENAAVQTSQDQTPPSSSVQKRAPHNTKNSVECKQCGVHCRDQGKLQVHMSQHSEIGRPWKCHTCSCRFTDKAHLRKHEMCRHGRSGGVFKASNNKCSICKAKLEGDSTREKHMKIHTETGRPFKCQRCPSFFVSVGHLRKHESRVHRIKSVKAIKKSTTCQCQCQVCGKLVELSYLATHMKIHRETDRPWKCSQCPSFFLSATHLRVHENEVHGRKPGKTVLECSACRKSYPADRLANHMNRVHKNRTKKPTSSTEQGNPARELLHQHRPMMPRKEMSAESTPSSKIREGNSARKCIHCNKTLNNASNIWQHMKIHQPGKGKPWKCTSCPAFFAAVRNLRMHENEIHRKNLGAFKCPTCGKRFSTPFNAKHHMKTVHGKRKTCSADIIKVDHYQQRYKSERGTCSSWQKMLSQLRPCNLVLDRCDLLISSYSKRVCSKENGMETDSPGSIENDNEGNESESGLAPILWEADQNDNQMELEDESLDSVLYAKETTKNARIRVSSDDDVNTSTAFNRRMKLKRVGNRMWNYKKRQPDLLDRHSQRKVVNGRSRIATKPHTAPRKIELFKCPFCSEMFPGTDGLIKHLDTHKDNHENERIPPSAQNNPKTDEAFSKVSDRGNRAAFPEQCHPAIEHELHECPQCSFQFCSQSQLRRHMRKLHSEVGRPWKCAECGCCFKELNALRRHESQRHGKRNGDSKCPVCNISLHSPSYVKEHMRVHEERDRPYPCPRCPSFFQTLNLLRRHEVHIHHIYTAETRTRTPCQICGKAVLSSYLKQHMKVHTETGRPFKCPQCPSFFTTPPHLRQHENQIHGRKPGVTNISWQNILRRLQPCKLVLDRCDHLLSKFLKSEPPVKTLGECEKSEESKKPLTRTNIGTTLKSKSLVATLPAKTKPEVKTSSIPTQRIYTCPYCFDSFVNPGLLIAHLPTHTTGKNAGASKEQATSIEAEKQINKEVSPTTAGTSKGSLKMSSDKKYKCSQCNFSCLADQVLQNHMKLHSMEGRPFQCSLCGCHFPTFKSLRNHEGRFHKRSKHLHHSAPEHKCKRCNYSSKTLAALKSHMKFHSDKGPHFKCPLCSFIVRTTHGLRLHVVRVHKGFNNRSPGHPATSKLH